MAANPAKTVRNQLSLEVKMDVIKMHDQQHLSCRAIVETLGRRGIRCGKTQIQCIIKKKREWIQEFEGNVPLDRKRKARKTGNEEINALLYEWFKDCTARMLPVSGPLLQEKARQIARELQVPDFKASNGWLEAFRKRHSIVYGKINGESGGVDNATIEDWKKKIPEIIEGYSLRDIYNLDETGLFYKASVDSTMHTKGEDCSGGKRSKERLTVMLCANALGEKETTIVIGKAIRPRCFGRMKKEDLPVDYHANKKAWMTSNIFEVYMKKLDGKMGRQGRKIIMLLDNATSHPHLQLQNVKLVFLPPNTTSITQPMDQGVIQTMKLKFRKRQLRYILQKLEANKEMTGPELMRTTDVLQSIYWVDQSWRDVDPDTIKKCFRRCGVGVPAPDDGEEMVAETDDVMEAACNRAVNMSLQELASIDKDLATADNRPASSVDDLQRRLQDAEEDGAESDEDGDEMEQPVVSKIKNIQEFASMLTELKAFAISRGCSSLVDACMDMDEKVNTEVLRESNAAKQTTLLQFFRKV